MELAIVGLARSGKTTVFNALTGGHAATGSYGAVEPNIGVVRVPDSRVDRLAGIFKPKKIAYAEITYLDFPGTGAGFGKEGPGGPFVNALARADALIHVVRAFEDPAVPHPEESVDPARDIGTMDLELAFADIGLIERRLQKLEAQNRSLKAAEREAGLREAALLGRMKDALEAEVPVRDQEVSADEWRTLSSYSFLTAKPVLIVVNIGEDDVARLTEIEAEYRAKFGGPTTDIAAVCGKLEQDLAQMDAAEADELRRELGLGEEAGLSRAIRLSYKLLGLISFLTAGEDECRAWTVPAGSTAPRAAGKIHTDLERGFIRAEVISFEDLVACGSYPEAKKRGLVRAEGKNYIVKDGDVLNILFNV
jgi:GTP-binding protein YchF